MMSEVRAQKRARMEEQNSLPNQIKLKSWSRNQSTVVGLEHIWIIENFSRLPQRKGEKLSSPIFSDHQSLNNMEWKIKLYPKGENEESRDFISAYLELNIPDSRLKLSTTMQFMLLNKSQSVIAKSSVSTEEFSRGNSVWGHPYLLSLDQITPTTLPGDELHVKCEVTYTVQHTSFYGPYPTLPLLVSSGSGSMTTHFKQLFESKEQSDIVIRVKKEKFNAHKTVLSARSPVFRAMFQSNLTETQTNKLKIKGITPAVFKELLRFMYTDQVEQLEELAEELLAAAEKYMLDLLKEKCVAQLAGTITVENCAKLLEFADFHSATGLKTIVLDFIRSQAAEVTETASWQLFMQSAKPDLLRDINNAVMKPMPKRSGATRQDFSPNSRAYSPSSNSIDSY